MRHARLQKLQRLRREWPFYVFLFYDSVTKINFEKIFQKKDVALSESTIVKTSKNTKKIFPQFFF